MHTKNHIIPFLVFAGFIAAAGGYRVWAAANSDQPVHAADAGSSAVVPLHATVSDLENAGFTKVQKAPVAGTRFTGPTDYFVVEDSVDPKNSEAPNIVMVDSSAYTYTDKLSASALYVHGTDNHPFSIPGGTGQEATMSDGRIAVSFIKGNNYTVVVGPNKTKIEKLTLAIANNVK